MPARHGEHASDPAEAAYLPTPHGMHVDSSRAPTAKLYFPSLHRKHSARCATLEYVPAGHGEQLSDPADPAYFPASHGRQRDDTAREYVPIGHGMHDSSEDAPRVTENVPALQ